MEILNYFVMGLCKYFTKSARIEATLQWKNNTRRPLEDILKPGAVPKFDNGKYYLDQSLVTKRWKLVSNAKLIIKNNSQYYAYNLILENSSELFTTIDPIEKLTSIAPNDKIELHVTFEQFVIEENGLLANSHAGIPKHLKNRFLIIKYVNESGLKLLTKSFMDFSQTYNVLTYQ